MARMCCVCKTSFRKGELRSFHRIPKRVKSRKLWLMILGNGIAINDSTYVCSDHFAPNDFVTKPSGIRYLRDTAVPLIGSSSHQFSPSTASIGIQCSEEVGQIYERPSCLDKEKVIVIIKKSLDDDDSESPVQLEKSIIFKQSAGTLTSILPTTTTKVPSPSSRDVCEKYDVDETSLSRHSSSTLTASEGHSDGIYVYSPNHKQTGTLSPGEAGQAWVSYSKEIQLQKNKIKGLEQINSRLRARISKYTSLFAYLKKKYNMVETIQSLIHASAPFTKKRFIRRAGKKQSAFKSNTSMRNRKKLKHWEEDFYCEICRQKFKTKQELENHPCKHKEDEEIAKSHIAESNRIVQCPESDCSESVCRICHIDCSAEGLESHMLIHDVKPLKCQCSGIFFSEIEYKKHLKDDCEVVRGGLEVVKDFKVENDVKEELEIDFVGIKQEIYG